MRNETKLEAVEQLHSREKSVKYITNDFEVSRQTIYHWKDVVLGPDFPARKIKNKKITVVESVDEVTVLKNKIAELELQNDILLQVTELLKKDLGIDQVNLTNSEKVQVINTL